MPTVSFGRELASVLLKVFGVLLTISLIGGVLVFFSLGFTSVSDGECNIAVMPIEGVIMPWGYGAQYPEFAVTPDDVRDFLTLVEDDDLFIEGVLFEVNSPGGTPVASEDIAKQIKALELPTAVLIGDMGASGGYMVSSAADRIFASAMSDVGSIGVTMSYVEQSLKNKEDGLTYVPLTTGKFKDSGSPEKAISDEERAYFQGQLDAVNTEFINLVANNRGLETDAVRALADGSTLVGQKAVDAKLVDQIGDREAVKNYFAEKLGKDVSEISFCEYVAPLF
jgi:protease IV